MNKFDFLQFNIPSDCIDGPNFDILGTVIDHDTRKYVLRSRGKKEISEYDIKLVFSLANSGATVGFSAKILGKDYPELINQNNIGGCIELLSSKYNLCRSIDVEKALQWGKCSRMEVTRDIDLRLSPLQFKNINNLIAKTHQWNLLAKNGTTYDSGFGAMRNNGSESIVLYDKEVEMALDKNLKFVIEHELENRFAGLIRVESKLNSRKTIRKRFGTDDLSMILKSDRNPLIEIFDSVMADKDNDDIKAKFIDSQRDRERFAYAKELSFDFGRISEDLRSRLGKNWKRDYKAIMSIVQGENPEMTSTFDLVKTIKDRLIFN